MDDRVVAVVLARGLGTRMRQGDGAGLSSAQAAAAAAGQKGMMPLAGPDGRVRPFLDFVLLHLVEAGYRDVVLVVAPPVAGQADPLRDYYTGVGRPSRIRVHFAVQAEPRGTADAVIAAASVIGELPFVVLNADNLYAVVDLQALRHARGPALPVYTRDRLVAGSGIPAERVGAFALLRVEDGVLTDIVEKPGADAVAAAGGDALISMNCWRGDAALLAACRDVPMSPRGEFEIPAAVRLAISRGVAFEALPAQGPVFDLSRQEDVPAVAARLRDVRVAL